MVETGGSGGGISSHSSVEKRGQKVGERGRDGARLFPMTRPKVGCAGGRGRAAGGPCAFSLWATPNHPIVNGGREKIGEEDETRN